jgi:23S rRNA U2552 (ribose-2'-O)-methylase RlmE/FtsJ
MIGTNLSIFTKIPLNLSGGGGGGGINWEELVVTQKDVGEFQDGVSLNSTYPWTGFMVDENHIAIIYDYNYVRIKIYQINEDRTLSYVDETSKDLTTSYGGEMSAVQIDATHFIMAYKEYGSDGFIDTYSIDPETYQVTELDSIEHDYSLGRVNSLAKIDDTHFLLSYAGGEGHLKVFSIDESYNITEGDVISTDYGASSGSLIRLTSSKFIQAVDGSNDKGMVLSININESYEISIIDTLEQSAGNSNYYNGLDKIDDTHFLLATMSEFYDDRFIFPAFFKTFSVDASYDNITEIDSFQTLSETSGLYYFDVVSMDSNHFLISCKDNTSSGEQVVKIIELADDYSITVLKTQVVDTEAAYYSKLIKIDETHFAIFYAGADSDGYYKVYELS